MISPSEIRYQNPHIWLSTRFLQSQVYRGPNTVVCQLFAKCWWKWDQGVFGNVTERHVGPGNLITLVHSFLQGAVSYIGFKHISQVQPASFFMQVFHSTFFLVILLFTKGSIVNAPPWTWPIQIVLPKNVFSVGKYFKLENYVLICTKEDSVSGNHALSKGTMGNRSEDFGIRQTWI